MANAEAAPYHPLINVRFGVPTADTEAALAGITSVERLEQLAERLLQVESWDDLLAQ
jgi:hypothetical protein